MSKAVSKRRKELKTNVQQKPYSLSEAIEAVKKGPKTKFDQSVELQFKLGVDVTASDQNVRGTAVLPHGQGKKIRVIVFSKDENAKHAAEAGASAVGGDELIQKVLGGWVDFDVAISTPAMMRDVGKLGKVLGPRGLMPSPKAGTVTDDPVKAISAIRSGRIEFKMDKFANLNALVGKLSFPNENLKENCSVLIDSLVRSKPKTLKGTFIRSAYLSSTMGPGIKLDISGFIYTEDENE